MKKPTKMFIHRRYKEIKGRYSNGTECLDLYIWNDGNVSLRTFHEPRSKAYVVLNKRKVENLIKSLQKAVKGWKL